VREKDPRKKKGIIFPSSFQVPRNSHRCPHAPASTAKMNKED